MNYRRLPNHIFFLTSCLFFLTGITSCSSTPKKPLEIFTTRNAAYRQLEFANNAISKNDIITAHTHIAEAWNLAVSCDDPELRIRVLLCKGNALFITGELKNAQEVWNHALNEALTEKKSDMAAASRVHLARVSLAEGNAADARKSATDALSHVSKEPLFIAQAWRVIGLSEKELGNSKEAEKAFLQAEKIHSKKGYLQEVAYDWYLIASSHSKAGQYTAAIEALHTALDFDRRCENAYAIGMDWKAIGLVLEKSGKTEEAKAAYKRSAAIFTAAGFIENARESTKKSELIPNSPSN